MTNVLTTSSTITCGHDGAVSKKGNAKLMVGGNPVLVKDGIGPSVSGCKTPEDSSKGTKPCPSVTISGGDASKLQVGSSPVMLDTVKGTGNGNPQGTLTASSGQTKLTAA